MTRVVLLSVLLVVAAPVSADVYIEATVMGMGSRTWTSGLRSRTEADVLVGGEPLTVITRLERKVKWTLDVARRQYQEEAVALPYGAASDEGSKPAIAGLPTDWYADRGACTGTVVRLHRAKTIAEFTATGYRVGCEEQPEGGMIVWLAPVAGTLGQARQETQAYEAAYLKARYKNFPPEEQPAALPGMSGYAELLSAIFGQSQEIAGLLPQGFLLAIQSISRTEETENEAMMLFEVQRVSTVTINPGLFRVPSGFLKVERLAERHQRGFMRDVNTEVLMQDVKELLQQMDSAEEIRRP